MDECIDLRRIAEECEIPTRRCMVCDCLENPKATISHTDRAWLCAECKTALQKLIEKEQTNGITEQNN